MSCTIVPASCGHRHTEKKDEVEQRCERRRLAAGVHCAGESASLEARWTRSLRYTIDGAHSVKRHYSPLWVAIRDLELERDRRHSELARSLTLGVQIVDWTLCNCYLRLSTIGFKCRMEEVKVK